MEERRNLLSSMAARGDGLLSVQQERLIEIKVYINSLREFLLNGSPIAPGANGSTPTAALATDTSVLDAAAPANL